MGQATAAHATAQLCARVACDGDGLSRSLGPSSTRLEITAFGDAAVESEAALQLAERRRKRLVKQRNDERATAAAAFAAAGKLADARQAKLLRDGAAAAAAAAVAFAAVSAEAESKSVDEALLLSNNAMDALETQLTDLRAAADEDRAGRAQAAHASREEAAHEDDASAAPKRAPPAAAPTMAPAAAPTAAIVEEHNAPLSVGDARRLKWFGAVDFQVNAVGLRGLADPRRVAQLLSAARKRGDATITFVFERDDPAPL
ncbi:hypothetical protein M885DRAFT_565566 [Pelagophyceae sp. CCMP2097]|nr:hypothetical protein M885DRAFT_565566 [Pelagophyceae sp. CCMP2097]